MLQIVDVTFPFFVLVLVGYVAAQWRMLPLESIPGLNTFVMFFALPCMLFRFAATTPLVRLLDFGVSITYLICALAMVALTMATTRRGPTRWNDASFGALVAAFPNAGFMGVPLLVALLGAEAAGPAIVALSIDMVVTSSLCIALSRLGTAGTHGASHALAQALKGMVGNPLPWAIFFGCASAASGVQPPAPVLAVIGMLATAASPVALFAIGAVLARAQMAAPTAAPTRRSDVPLLAAYKLAVHPALVFVAGKALTAMGVPLDAYSHTVLVLTAALPSASNVPILAERFGADSGRVARIVMLTTAAAFLSFSSAVALLGRPPAH